MVFVADGDTGVSALCEVRESDVVLNIPNAGDVVLPLSAVRCPLSAIRAAHSGKVVLDLDELDTSVREALNRVHDAEYREFATLDPADGTPTAWSKTRTFRRFAKRVRSTYAPRKSDPDALYRASENGSQKKLCGCRPTICRSRPSRISAHRRGQVEIAFRSFG